MRGARSGRSWPSLGGILALAPFALGADEDRGPGAVGREVAVPSHRQDEEELQLALRELLRHGRVHHGQYTTIREAVLAHCGEALAPREAFEALGDGGRDDLIELLKSLQVLPPGTRHLVVDERGRHKNMEN